MVKVRFEVSDVKEFRDIITVTESYVPELRLDCTSEGISFVALDQGHIVFIECELKLDWFTMYECNDETSFMLDTMELKNAISRIKGDGRLCCTLTDEYFILKHSTFDGSSKEFKLRLIDNIYDKPTPPSIPYPVTTKAEFSQLKEYTEDAMIYDNKLRFQFYDSNLRIISDNDYAEFDSNMLLFDNVSEACQVSISGENLIGFFKLGLNKEVTLMVGTDMPFHAILETIDESCKYSILIAPRLEEDV